MEVRAKEKEGSCERKGRRVKKSERGCVRKSNEPRILHVDHSKRTLLLVLVLALVLALVLGVVGSDPPFVVVWYSFVAAKVPSNLTPSSSTPQRGRGLGPPPPYPPPRGPTSKEQPKNALAKGHRCLPTLLGWRIGSPRETRRLGIAGRPLYFPLSPPPPDSPLSSGGKGC